MKSAPSGAMQRQITPHASQTHQQAFSVRTFLSMGFCISMAFTGPLELAELEELDAIGVDSNKDSTRFGSYAFNGLRSDGKGCGSSERRLTCSVSSPFAAMYTSEEAPLTRT